MNTNTYQVIDLHTKKVMGTYATRAAASRRADKLDLAYGAIRYVVKIIWADQAIAS
jgi:hypothetical protein